MGNKQDRFGVIAVDMENGGLHHSGHVGAIRGGASVLRVAGGEANLVVDDDMQRTAGGKRTGLGHIQRFHDNALARKGRVTVD